MYSDMESGKLEVKVEARGIAGENSLAVATEEKDGVRVFDFMFKNTQGAEQKIEGIGAIVTIRLSDGRMPEKLFYIDDQGTRTDVTDSIVSKSETQIVFKATHFSKYAVQYVAKADVVKTEPVKVQATQTGNATVKGSPKTGEGQSAAWAGIAGIMSLMGLVFTGRRKEEK